jgi:hypothetical protein
VRQFGSDRGRTGLVPDIKNLSILTVQRRPNFHFLLGDFDASKLSTWANPLKLLEWLCGQQ